MLIYTRHMSNPNPKDIKYLGVPNVCFSLIDANDKRDELYANQRIDRGFDDSETWSLSGTMASFLLPRLIRFIKLDNSVRDAEFMEDLNNFRKLLELEIRDNGARNFTIEEKNTVSKGLKAFEKIFLLLWW